MFSRDVILCGWLGWKHQLWLFPPGTNSRTLGCCCPSENRILVVTKIYSPSSTPTPTPTPATPFHHPANTSTHLVGSLSSVGRRKSAIFRTSKRDQWLSGFPFFFFSLFLLLLFFFYCCEKRTYVSPCRVSATRATESDSWSAQSVKSKRGPVQSVGEDPFEKISTCYARWQWVVHNRLER